MINKNNLTQSVLWELHKYFRWISLQGIMAQWITHLDTNQGRIQKSVYSTEVTPFFSILLPPYKRSG